MVRIAENGTRLWGEEKKIMGRRRVEDARKKGTAVGLGEMKTW